MVTLQPCLAQNVDTPRKNQIFKWLLDSDFNHDATNELHQFFNRLGFTEQDRLAIQLHHETEGFFLAGELAVKNIQHYGVRGLAITCNTVRYPNVQKYFRTENENGFGVFFAALGTRQNSDAQKVRFHVVDVDLGKELKEVDSREEAEQLLAEFQQSSQFDSVKVHPIAQKWQVVGQYTVPVIQARKQAYLSAYEQDVTTAIIVDTYNGYHLYFPVTNASIERFKEIQYALAVHFKGDTAITDSARILRMPYYFHVKNPTRPHYVQVIQWGLKHSDGQWVTHTQEQLVRLFQLKISAEQIEKIKIDHTPIHASKTVTSITTLRPKRTAITVFHDEQGEPTTSLPFALFLEQIKRVPLQQLFDNHELATLAGETFSCLFHHDERPSATIYTTEAGTQLYKCFASTCQAQSFTVVDMVMNAFSIGVVDAVNYLSGVVGVTIENTPFQRQVLDMIHQNFQWIKRNIECKNKLMSETPLLYSYFSQSMKHMTKELMVQLLSYPIQEVWSKDNYPIFFAGAEYLAKECKQSRKLVQQNLDILVYLGFFDKLSHKEVPPTLFRRTATQHTVNYFVAKSFDEVAGDAELLVRQLKEMKFRKREISYEYLLASFNEEVAARVYPNQQNYQRSQQRKVFVNNLTDYTETAFSYSEEVVKKTVSKKGFIREELMLTKLLQKFDEDGIGMQGRKWEATKQRTIMHLQNVGYERTSLTQAVALELGLKRGQTKDKRIYIWRKSS